MAAASHDGKAFPTFTATTVPLFSAIEEQAVLAFSEL
jgi:hypothetical protein